MEEQSSIPTSKVARATKFLKAGVKVGGNYIKHYSKQLITGQADREELHQANAKDVYETLSELKGSALKVAQMMSMDKSMLPRAYTEKFAMSQYSAPPLSAPLVVKTFRSSFGKTPQELFDTFSMEASNAASIGQVHKANKWGKNIAVKIQYPGVADSISSDLKMARPMAMSLLKLSANDVDRYFEEVEERLLEEANYTLELERSVAITKACAHIKGLVFPNYYPELSSQRILSMDWLEGLHLKEFLQTNPSQEVRNRVGQLLWDFYHFQIHELKQVHADPHPGNFLMNANGTLGVIDFGCIKVIPEDFYQNYFKLINKDTLSDRQETWRIFKELEFIVAEDSPELQTFFYDIFEKMILMLGRPFHSHTFDFSDVTYVDEIYTFLEELTKMEEIRSSKAARGSRHNLYINRTYFGLYTILGDLRAKVTTTKPAWLTPIELTV
jgi:predicted unusual protein kinase regulating ubiquinone biosynthesis (AarF/ABC1/UbiB family)